MASDTCLSDPPATHPALDYAAARRACLYRQEAMRLTGFAARSVYNELKLKFLTLAQEYETLADHAERSIGGY